MVTLFLFFCQGWVPVPPSPRPGSATGVSYVKGCMCAYTVSHLNLCRRFRNCRHLIRVFPNSDNYCLQKLNLSILFLLLTQACQIYLEPGTLHLKMRGPFPCFIMVVRKLGSTCRQIFVHITRPFPYSNYPSKYLFLNNRGLIIVLWHANTKCLSMFNQTITFNSFNLVF